MARTPKVVEDRREQIIDAAMYIFSQKGFARATNKDIALQAGITPGLIYHYFESKEALLQAIVEGRSPLRLINSLPQAVLEQPPDIFLRFLAQQVLVIVEGERFVQFIRIFLPEVLHNSNVSPIVFGALQQVLHFIESYIAARVADGSLRSVEPTQVAQLFMSGMIGFVFRRQIIQDASSTRYTQAEVADFVVDTLLKGLYP